MSNKYNQGFSLVEYIVAVIIIGISITSIMLGVVGVRSTSNRISIKDAAFQELNNYTEFWKAKIAEGDWSGTNLSWVDDPNKIKLFTGAPSASSAEFGSPGIGTFARLSKKAGMINREGDGTEYPYPLYSLETKITWTDQEIEGAPIKELNFKVYQIVFK